MKIQQADIFYNFGKYDNWSIDPNVVSAIKELKWIQKDGFYCPKVMMCLINDNLEVLENYRGSMSVSDFFNRCFLGIQFFARHITIGDIEQELIDKLNIKDHHINLINRFYFDEGNYNHYIDGSSESEIISNGDKRPFGNSSIVYDILEEYKPDVLDEEFGDQYDDECWKIYNEVLNITERLLQLFPMKFRDFDYKKNGNGLTEDQEKYYNHNWAPSVSEFRDTKIEKIIS